MKQIIPFEKKIKFETNIEEITSISLDKIMDNIKDNEISGVFDLYLEYKENDISINVEKYSSKIPFNIDIDNKYLLDNIVIDIDDFYYDIDKDNVLIHIDLLVDGLKLKEEEIEVIPKKEVLERKELETEEIHEIENIEDKKIEEIEERNIDVEDLFKEINNVEKVEIPINNKIKEIKKDEAKPIFETYDESLETYVTYNVHIVRDNDNIDTICAKYEITKEDLSYYNDITEIKLGDKLIVPTYKK